MDLPSVLFLKEKGSRASPDHLNAIRKYHFFPLKVVVITVDLGPFKFRNSIPARLPRHEAVPFV